MNIKPPKHAQQPPINSDNTPSPLVQPIQQSLNTSKPNRNWRSIFSTILLFTLAPLLALAIAAFGLQSYEVDGQSMEVTLQNHDRLIVDKIPRTWSRITHHPYIPKRGNIIVFNQAGLFGAGGQAEKQLIKRVIGLPGDRVVVKDGKITVYNSQNPKGFNPDTSNGYKITQPTLTIGAYSDVTLGRNQIFVSGDNRGNSEDSRYFGPINASQIVGQLVLRIVPLNKAERF